MTCGIYLILCVPTGKVYIGQSVNVEKRVKKHAYRLDQGTHWNQHLQYAWNKYGREAFTFSLVEISLPSSLTALEQKWLDSFDSELIFNISPVADSTYGFKHSNETKKKIADANRRRNYPPMSEAQKAQLSARFKGKPRKKLSSAEQERMAHDLQSRIPK